MAVCAGDGRPAEADVGGACRAQRGQREVGRGRVNALVKVEHELGRRQAEVEHGIRRPLEVRRHPVGLDRGYRERAGRHGVSGQVGKGAGGDMQDGARPLILPAQGGRERAPLVAREQERHRVGAARGRLDVGVREGYTQRAGGGGRGRDRQQRRVGRGGVDVLVEHDMQRARPHVERRRVRRVEGGGRAVGDGRDARHSGRRRRVAGKVGKGARIQVEARRRGRVGPAGQQGALLGGRQEQPHRGRVGACQLLRARQPDAVRARVRGRQRDGRQRRGRRRRLHVLVKRHGENAGAQVERGGRAVHVERRRGRVNDRPGRDGLRGGSAAAAERVARHVRDGARGGRDVEQAGSGRPEQGGDGGLLVRRHCEQDGLRVAQRQDAGAVEPDGAGAAARGGGQHGHVRRVGRGGVDVLVELGEDRPGRQVHGRAGQDGGPAVGYEAVHGVRRRPPGRAVEPVAHGRRRHVDRGAVGSRGNVRQRDRRLLGGGEDHPDLGCAPGVRLQRRSGEGRRAAGAVATHDGNARQVDGAGVHGAAECKRRGPVGKVQRRARQGRRGAAVGRDRHRHARGRQQGCPRRVAGKVGERAGRGLVDAHAAVGGKAAGGVRQAGGQAHFEYSRRLDGRERRAGEGDVGGGGGAGEVQEARARALRPHVLVELDGYRAVRGVQGGR